MNDLEIINGSINETFSNNKYFYEVSVDSNVSTLIFSYDIDQNNTITIYGNDELTDGENHVYVEMYDGNEVITYTFLVNKEVVNNIISTNIKENNNDNNFDFLRVPMISSISFIIIVILFCIIFRKK